MNRLPHPPPPARLPSFQCSLPNSMLFYHSPLSLSLLSTGSLGPCPGARATYLGAIFLKQTASFYQQIFNYQGPELGRGFASLCPIHTGILADFVLCRWPQFLWAPERSSLAGSRTLIQSSLPNVGSHNLPTPSSTVLPEICGDEAVIEVSYCRTYTKRLKQPKELVSATMQ